MDCWFLPPSGTSPWVSLFSSSPSFVNSSLCFLLTYPVVPWLTGKGFFIRARDVPQLNASRGIRSPPRGEGVATAVEGAGGAATVEQAAAEQAAALAEEEEEPLLRRSRTRRAASPEYLEGEALRWAEELDDVPIARLRRREVGGPSGVPEEPTLSIYLCNGQTNPKPLQI